MSKIIWLIKRIYFPPGLKSWSCGGRMGRRGGAAVLAGRAGTPAPQQHPREPAPPGLPSPGKAIFHAEGKPGLQAGVAGQAGFSADHEAWPGQRARKAAPLAGMWQEPGRDWGWGDLPPPRSPRWWKHKVFYSKASLWCCGGVFLRLFLNALLWRKMILCRGGPFSNYH